MFLLEYSHSQHCFHCNYLTDKGEFAAPLLVNDYCPVTLIPEEYASAKWFTDVQVKIMKDNLGYKEATEKILKAILKHTK